MRSVRWWVAWFVAAAVVAVAASAGWSKGGGGGGGRSSGGGGSRSSSGSSSRSSSSSGMRSSGGMYLGARSGYGGGSGRPMTPEERQRMVHTVAIAGGTTAVAGTGVGVALWARSGFDVVTLAFSLRRKRHYVDTITKHVEGTDFGQAPSRARLLVELASEIRTEDLDGGYVGRLGLKLNASRAGDRAELLERKRQEVADIDLDYEDGGQDTAEAARAAPDRDDDRCLLSVVATVPLGISRTLFPTSPGSSLGEAAGCEARNALTTLSLPVARMDGLWVFYIPAPDEPLPSASAHIILNGFREVDTDAAAGLLEPVAGHADEEGTESP